jgi:hypothetical protein
MIANGMVVLGESIGTEEISTISTISLYNDIRLRLGLELSNPIFNETSVSVGGTIKTWQRFKRKWMKNSKGNRQIMGAA